MTEGSSIRPDESRRERRHVVIAPMRTSDLSAVLRIEEAAFDEAWSLRLFEEELAQRTSRAYRAAWLGTELVAYGGIMAIDDEAHLNNIAVAETERGTGLGTVLLCDLVRTSLARGLAHLTLEVQVGNEPALALYRRFGLAPVGVRPDYYGPGRNGLIMWVRDIDTGDYAERLSAIEASVSDRFEVERRL